MNRLPPPLRAYQVEIMRAIYLAAMARDGTSLTVMVSRQGGKNEVSAQLEMLLLLTHAGEGGTIVKTAPTKAPQLQVSRRRLLERFRRAGLGGLARVSGDSIEVRNASITFLSGQAHAHVQGHTAGLLLEVDEAQHMDFERFERDFRPMVLTSGAPVVFYGTTQDEDSLLERMKAHHLKLEAEDGIRRHFEYDYQAVGRHYPAYLARALQQRDLLGEESTVFLTQYRLVASNGEGRLFSRDQLDRMRGDHEEAPPGGVFDRERAPQLSGWEVRYVGGLDIAGESKDRARDQTVLTIARVHEDTPNSLPLVKIVKHRAWKGTAWETVQDEVAMIARYYQLARLSVDATGLGHLVSGQLARELGSGTVERVNFVEKTKSAIGFELTLHVTEGRVRMYRGESVHTRQFWHEVEQARKHQPKANTLRFEVPEALGHDDYLMSLALCVHAANDSRPRIAVGFTRS